MKKIAQRYALAMFELAQEKNTIKHWQLQLDDCVEILANQPELFRFFTSVVIDHKDKKNVLSTTLSQLLDKEVLHFLFLLIDKRRMNLIKAIVQEYRTIANEHFNIKTGFIYSAYPLESEQIIKIQDVLSKSKSMEIQLKNLINPELLSGVKIVIDDEVTDGSLLGKMKQLKETLLKESR